MDLKKKNDQLISVRDIVGWRRVMRPQDVIYIEKTKNTKLCKIHYYDLGIPATANIAMNIGDLDEVLPNQFMRVHRAFIVNIRHVKAYDEDTVYMNVGHDRQDIPMTFNIGCKFVEL